jgi:TRAP-type mannitol/chloroaromatic compound transport system permease large subunit
MGFVPVAILFILFAFNIPVAYALISSALFYFLFVNALMPVDMIFQRMIASAESFPLLAVPFFIVAGTIMNYAGISKRLMNVADLLTGRMRGGLAHSNVVLSALRKCKIITLTRN